MIKRTILVWTLVINEKPWWVAKDVCQVLEIVDHKDALRTLRKNYELIWVDTGWVCSTHPIPDALKRQRDTNILREAGVYTLAFQSRKKLYDSNIG